MGGRGPFDDLCSMQLGRRLEQGVKDSRLASRPLAIAGAGSVHLALSWRLTACRCRVALRMAAVRWSPPRGRIWDWRCSLLPSAGVADWGEKQVP